MIEGSFVSYINIDLHGCDANKIVDKRLIESFETEACKLLNTKPAPDLPPTVRFAIGTPAVGYSLVLVTETRDVIIAHFAELTNSIYFNWHWINKRRPPFTYPMLTAVKSLMATSFASNEVIIPSEHYSDNSKVVLKDTNKYGLALFAEEEIEEGEIVAMFDGKICEAEKSSDTPNNPPDYYRDHAIQFEAHKWIDSQGFARFTSHSCEPNCGIKDKFKIVAMKRIEAGGEISFDYDMSENSDWKLERCMCGSSRCRGLIRGYRYLPEELKKEYQDYTSDYLI